MCAAGVNFATETSQLNAREEVCMYIEVPSLKPTLSFLCVLNYHKKIAMQVMKNLTFHIKKRTDIYYCQVGGIASRFLSLYRYISWPILSNIFTLFNNLYKLRL